jgi:hypothetical protein
MNKTMTGGEQSRPVDDNQVRATAHTIEIDLEAIKFYAADLQAKLEVLHKELEFADPVKDRLFEKFMYKLQRFILPLVALGELKELVKAMEEYGLPSAAEVAEIIRRQREPSAPRLKVFMPNIAKQLTEDPVHA